MYHVKPELTPCPCRHRTQRVLTCIIVTLVIICGTGSWRRLEAGEPGTLLITLKAKSELLPTATMNAISKRAVALGASKDDVVEMDARTFSVRLPSCKEDVDKAVRIIEAQGLLELRLVDEKGDVAAEKRGEIPPGDEILYKMDRNPRTGAISQIPYLVKRQPLMTGDIISDARTQRDYFGNMMVSIKFNSVSAREFERITGEHVGERLAIVLDNRVYSAPVIKDRISRGSAIIGGTFTPAEAAELALVLRCGPITPPVEVVRKEWLKPSSESSVASERVTH